MVRVDSLYRFFLMIRRPPRSTLFPYTTPLPISNGGFNNFFPVSTALGKCPTVFRKLSDRKSTRLNSSHTLNLVCRLLLEKKKGRPGREDEIATLYTSLACGSASYITVQSIFDRRGLFFFFNDTATTEIYTLSLHDALPI